MRCWQAGPQQPTLQGSISCGDTVEGNTGDPGVSNLGGQAVEHTYSFSVGWESSLNFDACASDCKQHHQATLAPHAHPRTCMPDMLVAGGDRGDWNFDIARVLDDDPVKGTDGETVSHTLAALNL